MFADDDATTDSESQHMSSIPVQNIIPERILINGEPSHNKIDKNRDKENYYVSPNNISISGENRLPLPVLRTKFPVEHPCDKFVLPSPPPRDRKRTGPRRKSDCLRFKVYSKIFRSILFHHEHILLVNICINLCVHMCTY